MLPSNGCLPMENRNRLSVQTMVSETNGTAEHAKKVKFGDWKRSAALVYVRSGSLQPSQATEAGSPGDRLRMTGDEMLAFRNSAAVPS